MRPACIKCCVLLKMRKMGFPVIEGKPLNNKAPRGRKAPEQWVPYKLFMSDLWECPECMLQIVIPADAPVIQDYEDGFAIRLKSHQATVQINDC